MSDGIEAETPPVTESGSGLDAIISSAIETTGYGEEPKVESAETEQVSDGRVRDEHGRFVAKEPAEAKTPEPGPVEAEAKPAEVPAIEPAVEQPIQPPAKWSDADKAEFAKLPRPLQELAVRRVTETEADYTRKTQELAEQRKSIEPLIAQVQQYDPLFKHLGVTANQFMEQSANVARTLVTGDANQKASAIAYLAQHHRVPPEAMLQALGVPLPTVGHDGQAVIDPTVLQLRQQVMGLEQSLQRMNETAQQTERQRAEYEFNALAQAKDEGGALKFPHFERTKQTMLQLVASNQAESWEQAYSKAVRLDDDLYQESVDTARKQAAEAAEKARQEAVDKAKKTQPVKSSSAPPGGGNQLKGIDAHLNAALEKAGFN